MLTAHLSSGGTSLSPSALLGLAGPFASGTCPEGPGGWPEACPRSPDVPVSEVLGDRKLGTASENSTSEPSEEKVEVRRRCRPATQQLRFRLAGC